MNIVEETSLKNTKQVILLWLTDKFIPNQGEFMGPFVLNFF